MDRSKVREIVKHRIRDLRDAVGLSGWGIDVVYESDGAEPACGKCVAQPEYRHATITLYPDRLDSVQEVEDVLFHELLHILHSDLASLTNPIWKVLDKNGRDILDELRRDFQERVVSRIEGMLFHGLGLRNAADVCRRGRRALQHYRNGIDRRLGNKGRRKR